MGDVTPEREDDTMADIERSSVNEPADLQARLEQMERMAELRDEHNRALVAGNEVLRATVERLRAIIARMQVLQGRAEEPVVSHGWITVYLKPEDWEALDG